MPWLRNNNVEILDETFLQLLAETGGLLRYSFYRSRNPLSLEALQYITLPFQLKCIPTEKRSLVNRFHTIAMPRGVEIEDACETILYTVRQTLVNNPRGRRIVIINTDNNQTGAASVINRFKENNWTEHDYRTALTCTPFHQVTVLTTQQTFDTHDMPEHAEPTVAIFTNVLHNEFVIKLGAILPLLYGYTIPEAITKAFLEGDKQAFIDAYLKEIADIIIERRYAEQNRQLATLEEWLKTNATLRIDTDISTHQSSIADYERRLRDLYQRLSDLRIRKASTFWGEADDSIAEFFEYLKAYDRDTITAIQLNLPNDHCRLKVVTPLAYWDEDAFTSYFNSQRGNCVTQQTAETKALLKNIFIDKTVKVTFHTGIDIHFNAGTVTRDQNYLPSGVSHIGIPHTHIYHHDCWGNNRAPIEKAFADRKYLIAWEQIKATLSGLNITDTTVFEKFCNYYIAGCTTPCLTVVATGEKLSPDQFRTKYPQGWVGLTPTEDTPAPVKAKRTRPRKVAAPVEETIDLNPVF